MPNDQRETAPDRIVSPGIVVSPERHSGDPCIAGRRLSAAMVVSIALGGDRRTLIDDYDLTDDQVDDALRWDREGRPSS
jgi:uncharacterized protein (DUF433 family)